MNEEVKRIDVGVVTAFADAKRAATPYPYDREKFRQDLANLGTTAAEVEANRQEVADNTQTVADDKTAVEADKASAAQSAAAAAQSAADAHTDALAATAAKEAAQTAQGSAVEAKEAAVSAKTGAESARTEANTSAVAAAGSALAAGEAAQTATAQAAAASDSATAAAASAAAAAESARTLTIDTTLTQAGQAADAKKTGEGIADLKSALDNEIRLITQKELIFDTSDLKSRRVVINTSNNWYQTAGGNLGSSVVFPLPLGADKIVVTAQQSIGVYIAFLKTFDSSIVSGSPDFCAGYASAIAIVAGESAEYKIPPDARYLYYRATNGSGVDSTPAIVFTGNVINTEMLIPRGNIVPNYTKEYDNTFYYANSAGASPSSGSSNSYATLVIPVEPSTHYVCNKLRYVTFIGEDGKSEAASFENVTEFTTLSSTKHIDAVFYKADNTKDNLIISSGYSLDSETGKYEIPWLYDTNKKALTNLENRTFGRVKPFLQYKGNDQSHMFDAPNSIKRDKVACYSCDFSSFGSVEVGLAGPSGGNAASIIIDATNVTVKKSGTSGTGIPHGLTISNRISVVLTQTVDGKLQYEISSGGEKYTGETAYTNGYTRFYFEASNMAASNVDFVSTCKDFSRDVWMFGDSYFSYGENRWVYYLINNGNSGRCLIDAYAGEGSERSLPSLKSYIDLAKPKYILWCVGMNDGSDSGSVPKAAWMTAVNEVLGICNENDITPVFGTIPTVPSINHEQKNTWIRNSGYQYIDFAKAVGAQSDGTWFAGMLSNDNVHPTVSGAMALYYQAITDFPQFLHN